MSESADETSASRAAAWVWGHAVLVGAGLAVMTVDLCLACAARNAYGRALAVLFYAIPAMPVGAVLALQVWGVARRRQSAAVTAGAVYAVLGAAIQAVGVWSTGQAWLDGDLAFDAGWAVGLIVIPATCYAGAVVNARWARAIESKRAVAAGFEVVPGGAAPRAPGEPREV